MPAMNRIFRVKIAVIIVLSFTFSAIPCSRLHIVMPAFAASDDTDKADKLGEDFQKQSPWFREKPKSDENTGTPQPEQYLRNPEGEKKEETQKYPYCRYPDCPEQYALCYNPDLDTYEYCYPADSDHFRLRFRSPKFRDWWERERACPAGYSFTPDGGCYPRR